MLLALAHGNRGRAPVHRISEDTRNRVVELARGPYQGLNHYHPQEVLMLGGRYKNGWAVAWWWPTKAKSLPAGKHRPNQ